MVHELLAIVGELEDQKAVDVVLLGEHFLGGDVGVGEDSFAPELGGGFLEYLGHGLAMAAPGSEEVTEDELLVGNDIGEVFADGREDI